MHIMEGLLSPQTSYPTLGAAGIALIYSITHMKKKLVQIPIPYLGILTALSFILMSLTLPLPGGTSAHASGIAILVIFFGIRTSYVALCLVLILQLGLSGAGGILSMGANSISFGVGAIVALLTFHIFKKINQYAASFAAGFLSTIASATFVAFILGLQPIIASNESGQPLYFPFGWSVTFPALLIPHFFIAIAEGVLTVAVYRLIGKSTIER